MPASLPHSGSARSAVSAPTRRKPRLDFGATTMCRIALPLLMLLALSSLAFAPAPLPRPRRGADPSEGIEGLWRGLDDLEVTATRLTYQPGRRNSTEHELRPDPPAWPPAYHPRPAPPQPPPPHRPP